MKFPNLKAIAGLLVIIGAISLFSTSAWATPVGSIHIDSGAGTVTVGLNSITWNGSFVVGGTPTLTSALGSPATGSAGTLLNLSGSTVFPLANFMTFATIPGLAFDLSSVGPGSANTNCASLSIGQGCSAFAGSPFILTLTATGTGVSLSVGGIARDGTTPSNWIGTFTTPLTGMTPAQIQSTFGCVANQGPGSCTNPSATVTSTFAGDFTATAVPAPEPGSIELMGLGLVGLFWVRRKLA